jgi:hypothetical protein
MRDGKVHWGVLAVIAIIMVVELAQHSVHPRGRTQRFLGVNASPKVVITFDRANLGTTNIGAFPMQSR